MPGERPLMKVAGRKIGLLRRVSTYMPVTPVHGVACANCLLALNSIES